MRKKVLLIIFVLIILIGTLYILSSGKKSSVAPVPIATFPNDTTKDYNNFRYLIPGKSTISDINKLNGKPLKETKSGDKDYLYYRAPFNNINPVLVKNNTLIYSSEYIFGDYRGKYFNFINAYGDPDKILYDGSMFSWLIFYKYGIAIKGGNNDISRIIYFIPNNIPLFYDTVAKDFNLSENQSRLGLP